MLAECLCRPCGGQQVRTTSRPGNTMAHNYNIIHEMGMLGCCGPMIHAEPPVHTKCVLACVHALLFRPFRVTRGMPRPGILCRCVAAAADTQGRADVMCAGTQSRQPGSPDRPPAGPRAQRAEAGEAIADVLSQSCHDSQWELQNMVDSRAVTK